jgi:cytochrome oxidase Cu insertion factor (SCO1/SenC/PrrC family)
VVMMAGWSPRSKVVIAVVGLLAGVSGGVVGALLLRPHVTPPVAFSAPSNTVGAALARQTAPPFTLTDQNGNSVSLTAEKGHVVLLTFLDPQCRQLCPVVGKDIGAIEQQLPTWIHPVVLIVSVAPGRTQADINTFLAQESPGWLPGWHWLLGPDEAALKLAWSAWHITVIPTATNIEHDALLDVIDREGYLRVTYPAPLYISAVASDIIKIARS